MRRFDTLGKRKAVLGVIHLAPLPGTPFCNSTFEETRDRALVSAEALVAGGADGCLLQTADRVYSTKNEADPARVAALAVIANAVVAATDDSFQVGVQIMRNAVSASLAAARIARGTFIRVTALVGATRSADGLIESNPVEVAAYRRNIDALGIRVIADIATMHYAWFDGDASMPVAAVARHAVNAGADAVAVSDPDEAAVLGLIDQLRNGGPKVPIILAGHTAHDNAARLLAHADGAFVGRCLEGAGWGSAIEKDRVRAYVEIVRALETGR